ncbi:MAG TPA: DUF3568 family protein [Mariprofundaceae bacterium]|nr:DUF3568 family protein [Mariprofundaceae bacterium]
MHTNKNTWNIDLKTDPAIKKIAASVIALVFGLAMTGCAELIVGAGIGAASAAYVEGNLHTHVKADPRTVEKASVQALKAMNIGITSSAGSAVDAKVVGHTATDKKVVIKAESKQAGESSLTIRVGILGDESTSRRIYDQIKKHLPPGHKDAT